MPAKRTPKPSPEEIKAAERSRLVEHARLNPHQFFGFEECGMILGFSDKAMGKLNAAGAPVAFRKMNPALIVEWIRDHPEKLASMDES